MDGECIALLRKFLGENNIYNPCSPDLEKPFELNGNTYYTNGHIVLRLHEVGFDNIAVSNELKDWQVSIDDKVFPVDDEITGDWVQVPGAIGGQFPCRICKGSGKIDVCKECGGDGVVEFENEYNTYKCDCISCGGIGRTSGGAIECDHCHGSGVVFESVPIEFGDDPLCKIGSKVAIMLQQLPNVEINTRCLSYRFAFRFSGGDGVAMGMRA